ncbi:MAG: 30S ribosomal protein S9, partial [Flavobacteriales bacterium]
METITSVGRRKTSVARIRMNSGKGKVTVNNLDYTQYFKTPILHYIVNQAFVLSGTEGQFDITVNVAG